jgi:isoamylase
MRAATMTDLRPDRPLPQGSTWDGDGVNFSLFSENAERVELCLLADDGSERRIDVRDRTAHLWHV